MTEGTIILLILTAIVIWIAALVIILRFAFRVKRQLWNQKTIINLLLDIVEKNGSNSNLDLKDIRNKNNYDNFL